MGVFEMEQCRNQQKNELFDYNVFENCVWMAIKWGKLVKTMWFLGTHEMPFFKQNHIGTQGNVILRGIEGWSLKRPVALTNIISKTRNQNNKGDVCPYSLN